ncbi:MAG: hypothetical protein V3R76_04455 [Gammaproteobacteria bacterium]
MTHLLKLDYSLSKRVGINLANFEYRQVDTGKGTHAAVAVTLVDCRTQVAHYEQPYFAWK